MGNTMETSKYHHEDRDNPYAYGKRSLPEHVPLRLLPTFAEMTRSDDYGTAFHGVLMIRKLLSMEEERPIQAVVDTGVVPLLVEYLAYDDWPEMQFEAACAVTDIAGGDAQEHAYMLVRLGAMPHLVRLLESDNEDIREQASWAVANIVAESADCRDFALSLGVMTPLLNGITMPHSKISVLRNAVWALANLCSPKLPLATECFVPVLPTLTALLKYQDREVVSYACWAISNICDGPIEHIHHVVQTGALDTVVELLSMHTIAIQSAALSTISNMLKAGDVQTVIDSGALLAFDALLCSNRRSIRRDACSCLTTICSGTPDHIQSVIAADLHTVIIDLMDSTHRDASQEALRCITKTTAGGTEPQLRYLIEKGVVEPLCRALKKHEHAYDASLLVAALRSLRKLLAFDSEIPDGSREASSAVSAVVNCHGVEAVAALVTHPSTEVRDLAKCVLTTFFAEVSTL